jgi:putative oxidoreductase
MMRAAEEGKSALTTSTASPSVAAHDEPRLIIPQFASFYEYTPGLSWLIVRLTAGGMLLVHGIMKAMPMAEKGLAATLAGFAANILARRGIEPSLPLAYGVLSRDGRRGLHHTRVVHALLRGGARDPIRDHRVRRRLAGRLRAPAAVAGEYPLFWGLIMFAIALRGGGPYSVDRRLRWEL